jgi:hypothetical protein
MPHDKKGRLIEVGDHVAFREYDGTPRVRPGAQRVNSGATTCNVETIVLAAAVVASPRTITANDVDLVRKADGSEPVDAPASVPQADGGFARSGVILAAGLLALAALVAPALAQDAGPAPVPSPSPKSAIAAANAAPLSISTELGGLVTLTPEGGTSVTPTGFINIEGPLVLGHSSIARAYARLGITSDPGADISLAEYKNWKAAEVGLGALRVVGASGEVTTSVVGEFSFSSRIRGSSDTAPLQRLVRSAAAGVRFDAAKTGASMTALLGYDEATTRCAARSSVPGSTAASPSLPTARRRSPPAARWPSSRTSP